MTRVATPGKGLNAASWLVPPRNCSLGRCLAWLVLLAAIVAGGIRLPLQPAGTLEDFTARLGQRVPALMAEYGVPGLSLALVKGGEPVWSTAYGDADAVSGRDIAPDAVYRAESISKSVTAWGVLRLVEQEMVGLDDPVTRYLDEGGLPVSPFREETVTVRQLLSHTAGMPLGTIGVRYSPGADMPSLREGLVKEARLVREPGSGFEYSNVGYHVLEAVVENVTGLDFAEYMKQEVLAPLGMADSTFSWNPSLTGKMPVGHDLQGRPVQAYVYPEKASGGLLATVEDIARFAGAADRESSLARQTGLSAAGQHLMYVPVARNLGVYDAVADAYGMGHFVEELPGNRTALWHGGQGTGWMSHFHVVPESGDGIVILTNSQRSWPLIAAVLGEWAQWSGAGSVQMSRITTAVVLLRVVVAGLAGMGVWQGWALVRGIRAGRRRWAPASPDRRKRRVLQASAALLVLLGLAWATAQPYLMVSSVFPGVSAWAGWALAALALVNMISAATPRQELHPGVQRPS